MKAFLLAAGYGTRLKPLTDSMPKCLVPIGEKPLLYWWLELFNLHGVKDVMVNTHYMETQVREYIEMHNKKGIYPKVVEYYEPFLLGSGGTVKANREFIGDDDNFLICYADNLTSIDLTSIIEFHKQRGGILTMALFRAERPKDCGIAQTNENGRISEFIEKPEKPKGNLANAGIYVARGELFNYMPDNEFSDLGKDVLPVLAGKMYGWETKDFFLDIGTPENYRKAQKEWKR